MYLHVAKMDISEYSQYGDMYETYPAAVQTPNPTANSGMTEEDKLTSAHAARGRQVRFEDDNLNKGSLPSMKNQPQTPTTQQPLPPPPPAYPPPKADDKNWSLNQSLGEITKGVNRDFFGRSDATVESLAKAALAKLDPDSKLVITAYMNALIDVSKRDLAEATPMRLAAIKYACPVYCLGASRDLDYVQKKGIFYTVYAHQLNLIADVLRFKIRQKYAAENVPERFIEVVVLPVEKKWYETMTTLFSTRVIKVFICNVTQMYTTPPIEPGQYEGAGIKTISINNKF